MKISISKKLKYIGCYLKTSKCAKYKTTKKIEDLSHFLNSTIDDNQVGYRFYIDPCLIDETIDTLISMKFKTIRAKKSGIYYEFWVSRNPPKVNNEQILISH